jgi:4-hydroxybenzoate polyprenyltransferase
MATVRGYVRLLRLPLFITAAADAVAGYTVAWFGLRPNDQARTPWDPVLAALVAAVSTGLYLFGMVENDLADRERDRRLLSDRPLATGEAGVGGAVLLLIVTAALAGFCALGLFIVQRDDPRRGAAPLMVIATFAVINLYNLSAKRGPPPVAMGVMGLARLMNFGIGVTAAIGVPMNVDWAMLGPRGPFWVRHGLAIACTSVIATGYSISARRGYPVSTRPWQAVLLATVFAGLAMWMVVLPLFAARAGTATTRLVPPLARVVALVVLALLWPGRLWSPMGPQRKPAEYAPFIERALYWLVLLDAAFVVDRIMLQP